MLVCISSSCCRFRMILGWLFLTLLLLCILDSVVVIHLLIQVYIRVRFSLAKETYSLDMARVNKIDTHFRYLFVQSRTKNISTDF